MQSKKSGCTVVLFCMIGAMALSEQKEVSMEPGVMEKVVVDNIWSSVRVGFSLLTHGDIQYVAYYNSDRDMVVAQRTLPDGPFVRTVLPSRQGWDSHNYITMAIDKEGYIHLSGNMHACRLIYFRSRKPGDATTLKRVETMVGALENRCTYPKFMESNDGELLFHYRHGGSGNGNEIYNIYATGTKTWRRFLDTPLVDGKGKMNAYQNGPGLGPDGWYHLLWMWRDTPDAATNHDLSYARSRDLLHWENAAGESLELPITFASKGTIVDPVPAGGGIINTIHRFGFDSKKRVVVTYHKHDEHGDTQAYAARFDNGEWRIRAISDWQGRHIFKGGGSGPSSFGTSISLGTIKQHGAGALALPFRHWKAGAGLLVIDEETLAPLRVEPQRAVPSRVPTSLSRATSAFPGMGVRWREDSGKSPDPSSRYVLRWETLGSHRDRPRKGELPANGPLMLYKLCN